MSASTFLKNFIGDSCICVLDERDVQVWVDSSHRLFWVIFDLKDRPVNVLNLDLTSQFDNVFASIHTILESTGEVVHSKGRSFLKPLGVLITSGKVGKFIAGADVDAIYPIVDAREAYEASKKCQNMFEAIETLDIPSFAVLNGDALGGGLELALACSFRIAIRSKKLQIGLPEAKLGLLPGGGGTFRLPRLIGIQNAMGLILAGKSVRVAEALRLGIIDHIVEAEDSFAGEFKYLKESIEFALSKLGGRRQMQHRPDSFGSFLLEKTWPGRMVISRQAASMLDSQTRGKYPGSYFALDSILRGASLEKEAALELEAQHFGTLASSTASKALISIFYMIESTKKLPLQLNTAPSQILSERPIQSIGIIGAGVMGRQIGLLVSRRGYSVYLRDINQEVVNEGIKFINDWYQRQRDRGRIDDQQLHEKLKSIRGGTELGPFQDCDLVIEAAVESLDLKRRILSEVIPMLSSHCIFATNTSSISISSIAEGSEISPRILGIHFFNPVSKMPLVEIIMGKCTSNLSGALSYNFAASLGKIPVVCKDAAGFIVNRILGIYINEAGRVMLENNSISFVDKALLEFGMPMGPFRLMDEVGLDVADHVSEILFKAFGDRFARPASFSELLSNFKHDLGVKTGKGIYMYSNAKATSLNPRLQTVLPKIQETANKPISKEMIIDRCILIALQEAAYILDEGVVASPEELDLAMIMGTGFAPFRGGLLNYADQRGLQNIVLRLEELHAIFGERFLPHPLLRSMAAENRIFFPKRPHGMHCIERPPRSTL